MRREQLEPCGVVGGSPGVVIVHRSITASRVSCGLCHGLLRDATTISECLHAFCRSCIYEMLTDEEASCCPTCNIDLGCAPLDKLRTDHSLQSVREKLFPSKRQKVEEVPSLHPASPFLLPLGVHGENHPAKNAHAYLSGEPMGIDRQRKNKDLKASHLFLVSNVAAAAENAQHQEDIEPMECSLEISKRQAEDACLVYGEEMRLNLHKALAEDRDERDAARKKVKEAEADYTLLRTQTNEMLEAALKQAADAVNSSKEAEKRAAHADQRQAEVETKFMQLWQKVEQLLPTLENAKCRAEDAGVARGEQARLQLQNALAEACKERDEAMKKAEVAEASCALLAIEKWAADAERCRAKDAAGWIATFELFHQQLVAKEEEVEKLQQQLNSRPAEASGGASWLLEELLGERDGLRQALKEVKDASSKKLEDEFGDSKLSELRSERERLRTMLKKKDDENTNLTKSFINKCKEFAVLEQKFNKVSTSHTKKIKELEDKLEDSKLSELRLERERLRTMLKKKDDENTNLTKSFINKSKEFAVLEQKFNKVSTSHTKKIKELKDKLEEPSKNLRAQEVIAKNLSEESNALDTDVVRTCTFLNEILTSLKLQSFILSEGMRNHVLCTVSQAHTLQGHISKLVKNQMISLKEWIEDALCLALAKLKDSVPDLDLELLKDEFRCDWKRYQELIEESQPYSKVVMNFFEFESPSTKEEEIKNNIE